MGIRRQNAPAESWRNSITAAQIDALARHRVGVANQGAGQPRLMDTRQASAPLGSMLMSILEGSIECTCHPSRKLALISSWVTRLGPQSPGWRSLKHSI